MYLRLSRVAAAGSLLFTVLLMGCGSGLATSRAIAAAGSASSAASNTSSTASSSTASPGAAATTGGTANTGSTSSSAAAAVPGTSIATAARLLDQSTFGPTLPDISAVQAIGVPAWLRVQYATPPTLLPMLPVPLPAACPADPTPCFESEFWQAALSAPDQLRQRTALTLSELFVTSSQSVNAYVMVPYYNMLVTDAFSNWRILMEDVTRSPAMGMYLNMLNSGKASAGEHANENFAREMLQLFSLGLNKLNNDGTPQLDVSGHTVPTFTQAQVEAFADTYTGWTYAATGGPSPSPVFPATVANIYYPLAGVDTAHDTRTKTLLNGTVVQAGGTAAGDLKIALDNIFADPSLPPFVCRQLIRHLVTSNPSRGYVQRVSTVFINNGSGVRGDMKAVLTAILTDSEARAGDTDAQSDGGHLREPILYLSAAVRALGFTSTNTDSSNQWAYMGLSNYSGALSQQPLRAPSVFNFYSADYVLPGTSLAAPEFALENTASVLQRETLADTLSSGKLYAFSADFGPTGLLNPIAGSAENLTDVLGLLLMHGQMPADMRSTIVSTIAPLTDRRQRVSVAAYLVLSNSRYKIMH